MRAFKRSKQGGFTLVELAIVLMIVGLLIGGVLKGQELANQARVINLHKQIISYKAAYVGFLDKYSAPPGDLATARNRLPNCDDTTFCYNGNGNSLIGRMGGGAATLVQADIDDEPTQFWRHLLLADFISGMTTSDQIAWGESHPASNYSGGFHVVENTDWLSGNALWLRLQQSATGPAFGNNGTNPLPEKVIARMDAKYDDGHPDRGYIAGEGQNGFHCQRNYEFDNENHDCILLFRLR